MMMRYRIASFVFKFNPPFFKKYYLNNIFQKSEYYSNLQYLEYFGAKAIPELLQIKELLESQLDLSEDKIREYRNFNYDFSGKENSSEYIKHKNDHELFGCYLYVLSILAKFKHMSALPELERIVNVDERVGDQEYLVRAICNYEDKGSEVIKRSLKKKTIGKRAAFRQIKHLGSKAYDILANALCENTKDYAEYLDILLSIQHCGEIAIPLVLSECEKYRNTKDTERKYYWAFFALTGLCHPQTFEKLKEYVADNNESLAGHTLFMVFAEKKYWRLLKAYQHRWTYKLMALALMMNYKKEGRDYLKVLKKNEIDPEYREFIKQLLTIKKIQSYKMKKQKMRPDS